VLESWLKVQPLSMYIDFWTGKTFENNLESQILTSDLLRAFTRYFENNLIRYSLLTATNGEAGGVYALLETEEWYVPKIINYTGRYRIVKPSELRSNGRRSTHLTEVRVWIDVFKNDDVKVVKRKPGFAISTVMPTITHTIEAEDITVRVYEREDVDAIAQAIQYRPVVNLPVVFHASIREDYFSGTFQGEEITKEQYEAFFDGYLL
jgi:hypothetical protein